MEKLILNLFDGHTRTISISIVLPVVRIVCQMFPTLQQFLKKVESAAEEEINDD